MRNKVILTRPKLEQNKIIKKQLEKDFNIKVKILELVEIVPIDFNIKKAIGIVDLYDCIGFTSQNGVEIFYSYLANYSRDGIEKIRKKTIVAIGPKTAEKIKQLYNIDNVYIPSEYTSESLEVMLSKMKLKTLLLRSALSRKINLHNVDEIYIYNLHPIQNKPRIHLNNYDLIILTSSFITKIFFSKYAANDFKGFFIPIGPTTHKELLKYVGVDKIIQHSHSYTISDAVSRVINFLHTRQNFLEF
ncbi:MAG: uroporphyrinogen-III synthase [bacterium]